MGGLSAAEATHHKYLTIEQVRDLAGCSRSEAHSIIRRVGSRPGPAG